MTNATYVHPTNPPMNVPSSPTVVRDRTGRAKKKRPKTKTTKLPLNPTPTQLQRWINSQVTYPNLAGTSEELDQRVIAFVDECRRAYLDKTRAVRQLWKLTAYMMRGHSLADTWGLTPKHVPEIYKGRENITARVEEAVLQFDQPFRVKGRDKMDREVADILQSWMEYRVYQLKFGDKAQPLIRMMHDTKACVAKMGWDFRVADRIKTEVKEIKNERTGTIDYQFTRKAEETVIKNEPYLCPLDTLDFLIDTKATDEEDALFIGDVSRVEKHEILDLCELEIFSNAEKVEELKNHTTEGSEATVDKLARSLTERQGKRYDQISGAPEVLEMVELWCRFDLHGDGNPVECVLNVLNGRVCVRAQENFYDEKFRPYAFGRMSEDVYEFFTPTALDHAIPLNNELDQHRTLALESHKLSVVPLVFTETSNGDMPDSVLGIYPGRVFQGVGKVEFSRSVDTLSSWPGVEATLKRDIEETLGVPRIFEGSSSESGDTATEIERKVQEGNRRIKGTVRAFSRMFDRVLRIIHKLDAQFVTKDERFRVLGKSAKHLGDYAYVKPTMFRHEIDFELVGIMQLQSLGLRATSLANFLNMLGPYLPLIQDKVNLPKIFKEFYKLTVGMLAEDELIDSPKMLSELMTPEEENQLLMQGQHVDVEQLDPDDKHIPSHLKSLEDAVKKGKPRQVVEMHTMHVLDHLMNQQKKEVQQAAAQQRAPAVQQPPMAGADGGIPSIGAPAQKQGGGEQPARTPRGESAGPPQQGKTAAPGRQTPYSQGDNMRT